MRPLLPDQYRDIVRRALTLFQTLRDNQRVPAWQELGFVSAAEAFVLVAREMADDDGSMLSRGKPSTIVYHLS